MPVCMLHKPARKLMPGADWVPFRWYADLQAPKVEAVVHGSQLAATRGGGGRVQSARSVQSVEGTGGEGPW